MGIILIGTNSHMYQVSPTASTSQSAAMADSKFPILEEDFSRQVMMQMTEAVMKNKLRKGTATSFLDAARKNLEFLNNLWSSPDQTINTSSMVQQIP
jgi:hypothetical protein